MIHSRLRASEHNFQHSSKAPARPCWTEKTKGRGQETEGVHNPTEGRTPAFPQYHQRRIPGMSRLCRSIHHPVDPYEGPYLLIRDG